ncbi:3-beta hydroxysteroid dehydrogenase/isomerase [Alteracholeplasma palmae J233]|uniref:3-beta hydroxysteroid dehydrogenase/isomerase n=1 Tax=Alteracholeplasma palmae (strain ATCC 49389 / J233) TaxID=1318466 RepID=U4KQB6_ALTPJ|nr:NAD(P)H-binding protein [Alteracholeplasma palmae]CCV64485.1 3-beta hydroxysteroid dehydrogenase/isomerase [Alteracholeplasma palmae J233]
MKIAIIGANGFIGSKIRDEALLKNHEVVAITRASQIKKDKNLKGFQQTIFEPTKLKKILKDVDVIVSAYHPGWYHVDPVNRYLEGYEIIIKLAKELNKRLIIIGGSTNLDLADGTPVVEGFFPAPWKDALEGTRKLYELIKDDKSFDWTYLAPAAEVIDTVKTGNYAIGENTLIVDSKDVSRISTQDLAEAVILEIENPKYKQKRFTLGYK